MTDETPNPPPKKPDRLLATGLGLYTVGSIIGLIGFLILLCVCVAFFFSAYRP